MCWWACRWYEHAPSPIFPPPRSLSDFSARAPILLPSLSEPRGAAFVRIAFGPHSRGGRGGGRCGRGPRTQVLARAVLPPHPPPKLYVVALASLLLPAGPEFRIAAFLYVSIFSYGRQPTPNAAQSFPATIEGDIVIIVNTVFAVIENVVRP